MLSIGVYLKKTHSRQVRDKTVEKLRTLLGYKKSQALNIITTKLPETWPSTWENSQGKESINQRGSLRVFGNSKGAAEIHNLDKKFCQQDKLVMHFTNLHEKLVKRNPIIIDSPIIFSLKCCTDQRRPKTFSWSGQMRLYTEWKVYTT